MIINKGELYFIKDEFFQRVNDPFLKCNYETTKRPHYYTFQDHETKLYWMVPCSSKVQKFENIIQTKVARGKPVDGIAIVKIQGKKSVLLFQDMFPVRQKYIEGAYIRQGIHIGIRNPEIIKLLDKKATKAITLLRHGVKFTATQPDINRIERLLIDEEREERKVSIIKDIKNSGYEPTVCLIDNLLKLQNILGKKCTLRDVTVLKKFEDITKDTVKDTVNSISEECQGQELSRIYGKEI